MKVGFFCGEFDVLRIKQLKDLDKKIKVSKENGDELFCLLIFSDELIDKMYMDKPLKSLEDRMLIASSLKGVDFVVRLDSLDTDIKNKAIEEGYAVYKEKQRNENNVCKDDNEEKEFENGYVPGTFDLFHAGHLENLVEASKHCKHIIAGVKSDRLVQEHKRKTSNLDENERKEILEHLKMVDEVIIYDDRNVENINRLYKNEHNDVGFDAAFYGSDLEEDFKDVKDVKIVFTKRDKELMKERSTTNYSRKILLRNNEKHLNYIGKNIIKQLNDNVGNSHIFRNNDDEMER